jgi:hypothetical protein
MPLLHARRNLECVLGAVMSKKPPSRNERDSFIAFRGEHFRQQTDCLRRVATDPSHEVQLRAVYLEASLAIVEDGGRLPVDDGDNGGSNGRRMRMSGRLWRPSSEFLERAGILTRTPDGYWMTPLAADELARRAVRVRGRLAGEPPAIGAPITAQKSENGSDNNGGISPSPLPPPSPLKPPVSPKVSELAIRLVADHASEELARSWAAEYVKWQSKPSTKRATNDDLTFLTFCENPKRLKHHRVRRKMYWDAKAECREVAA